MSNTEQLTPKQAIKLLDEAIARKALPQSTGAHWRNAFNAVFQCHPDFDTMADIHPETADSFLRYYMMHTKDSHSVSTERVGRFKSALTFVKAYHLDPRGAVESRRVRHVMRNGNDKPKPAKAESAPVAVASNGAPPLTLLLRSGVILTLTGVPSEGLTSAERAKLDHWLDLIPEAIT